MISLWSQIKFAHSHFHLFRKSKVKIHIKMFESSFQSTLNVVYVKNKMLCESNQTHFKNYLMCFLNALSIHLLIYINI